MRGHVYIASMFKRNLQCFFCNAEYSGTNSKNFRCGSCGCWNRYDSKGEILSSEAAMYQEELNTKSFAKRASPSKQSLPTTASKSSFCHSCLTNQMLLINMLSSYLPDPTSPEYESRLKMLPEYKENLYHRYPVCCESCEAAVEAEIKSKDNMARSRALGGWLKETKGKEYQKRISGNLKDRQKLSSEIFVWRVRGCLWVLSFMLALLGNSLAALEYPVSLLLASCMPYLPILLTLSLFWAFWDPTYSRLRNAQIQGRDIRIKGKQYYLILQSIAWVSRMLSSILINMSGLQSFRHLISWRNLYFSLSLAIETSVFISSCFVLRVRQPPSIRLLHTTSHPPLSRASTPNSTSEASISESDLFASLSLSSKSVIPSTETPVFGRPSLKGATLQPLPKDDAEMDWTPTNSSLDPNKDDGSWIHPQRFFAPEKPTGLEDLLQRTILTEDVTMTDATQSSNSNNRRMLPAFWWLLTAVVIVPVVALTVKHLISIVH